MHEIFARWNESRLNSYLIEITGDILAYRDEDGEPLVEYILDTAGQKGNREKWTVEAALNQGECADADRGGGFLTVSICNERRESESIEASAGSSQKV